MAASGRTSAPVAACGILVALGAPNSYNFIYSRFPFNGWIGAFTSEQRAAVIFPAEYVLLVESRARYRRPVSIPWNAQSGQRFPERRLN